MVGSRWRAAAIAWLLVGCAGSTGAGRADPEVAPDPSRPREPTVTAEDIERSPGRPIEEVLMSRFPGVVVTRAGGGIAIRIRGATSIRGGTEPLVLIDDVEVRPGPGGVLSGINLYDIESIKVLTDPADTAMYGMRGANGVIVIKTKQLS